jgi:O-antigen/teichoic acid export membrane protein
MVLTGGLAVTWVVSLAIRLALPQFLDPAGFGRLVFCESLALLLFAPLTLGIDTYARREVPLDPTLYGRLIRPLAAARSAASVVMAAAGVVVLSLLGRPASVLALFACYAVAQFALNGGLVSAAFLQGGGRATSVTVTQIATKLLWAALAIAGLAIGGGALVIPVALAASEGLRVLWLRRDNRRLFGRPVRADWLLGKVALVACMPLAARQLSIGLSNSLDTALVGGFAGDTEVALYGAATLIAMTALFLAPALSAALLPALSRTRAAHGPAAAVRLGGRIMAVVVAVMAPLTTVLALESDDVIVRLFGADYAAAVPSLRVLSMMFVLTYMATIGSNVLIALGRTWPVSLVSIVTVAINTVANLVLLRPAATWFGPGGPSLVASCAVFGAEAFSAAAMVCLAGRGLVDRTFAVVVAQAIVGCGLLATVHTVVGGRSVGFLAIEAVLALALAAAGARRPIRALRTNGDTLGTQSTCDARTAVDKERIVGNRHS